MAFTRATINKEYYTAGEIAKLFNVSHKTVQELAEDIMSLLASFKE